MFCSGSTFVAKGTAAVRKSNVLPLRPLPLTWSLVFSGGTEARVREDGPPVASFAQPAGLQSLHLQDVLVECVAPLFPLHFESDRIFFAAISFSNFSFVLILSTLSPFSSQQKGSLPMIPPNKMPKTNWQNYGGHTDRG